MNGTSVVIQYADFIGYNEFRFVLEVGTVGENECDCEI